MMHHATHAHAQIPTPSQSPHTKQQHPILTTSESGPLMRFISAISHKTRSRRRRVQVQPPHVLVRRRQPPLAPNANSQRASVLKARNSWRLRTDNVRILSPPSSNMSVPNFTKESAGNSPNSTDRPSLRRRREAPLASPQPLGGGSAFPAPEAACQRILRRRPSQQSWSGLAGLLGWGTHAV